jgi:hypothetical protein
MAAARYKWPGDRPGSKLHTITWDAYQASLKNGPAKPGEVKVATKKGFIPVSEWDFGYGKGVMQPPAEAPTVNPGVLPPPPDPIYDDEIAGLARRRDDTVTGLGQGRQAELLGYGYTEDPNTRALAFDPNNPFSRASLLKRNYDVSRSRTGNQMASGGQLYAGAFQTSQDAINRGQLGAEDALQQSLTSWLAQNTQRKAQAGIDYETDAGRAAGRSAARALDSPLYTPTAQTPIKGAGTTTSAGGTPKPPAIKKPASIRQGNTLTAAPGLKGIQVTKKGNRKTYTAAVRRA